MPTAEDRPKTWSDWYRLARGTLGYLHEEAVEYANHRFVEEQNRERIPRRTLRRA